MTQNEKLIDKFKTNPNSVSMQELQKILTLNGYILSRQNASHMNYTKEWESQIFTLPKHGKNLKNVYKQKVYKKFYGE